MELKEINIKLYFIIIASEVEKCSKVIRNIYEKDEAKYFNLYLNSNFNGNELIDSLSYSGQKTAIELIGILEEVYKTHNFYIIEKIISAYDNKLIKACKKQNKLEANNYCKKKINVDLSEFELLVPIVFTSYYLNLIGKPCLLEQCYIESLEGKWKEYTEFMNVPYLMNSFSPDPIKIDEEIKKAEELLGIDIFKECYLSKTLELIKKNGSTSVDELLDNILHEYELDLIKTGHIVFYSNSDYQKFRRKLFDSETISREAGVMSLLLSLHGLNDFSIYRTKKISLIELKTLIYSATVRLDANNYNKKELPILFLNTIMLNTIMSEYSYLKNKLLNKSEIKRFNELKILEEELNSKSFKLEKDILKFKETIINNNNELKEIKTQLKSSKVEIVNLTKELSDSTKTIESLNQEIELLTLKLNKEIVANKGLGNIEINNDEPEISLEEKIEFLNTQNISIVGGANNIKNILNVLPNIFLFNDKNKDIAPLHNYDFIFINSDFISHSLVYKLNGSNLEYNYIGGTNFNLIIDLMYSIITKK